MYAQDFAPDGEPQGDAAKIDVDGVVELYESYIIPLTKEVEVRLISVQGGSPGLIDVQVDYLLARLEGLSPEQIDDLAKGKGPVNGIADAK